ncbi:hypothetical protein KTT_20170 [Tengunoibacter tsumagoiensis]|uniref:Uncharacterized protein n=1 Tax=Tengunoibacter tsumagoiensis TaxID=2014871 RepID=A0A401ZZ66_9CHLR|nr:hypothetical protein KTT_20170 [Tengunoibacter tsumagoiensis]
MIILANEVDPNGDAPIDVCIAKVAAYTGLDALKAINFEAAGLGSVAAIVAALTKLAIKVSSKFVPILG